MKRFVGGLLLVAVMAVVASNVAGVAMASGSDFTIKSFDAQYYLGADSEGRSTVKTVESIVADFSESNQDHGVQRIIPKTSGGHPTDLAITSVTDGQGVSIPYTLNDSADGNLIVQIGDFGKYIHGEQHYSITYTQRDVTTYLKNVPDDEFDQDITGTGLGQPIGTLTATVHLSDAIKPTFTKKISCNAGSTTCQATTDGTTVTVKASNVQPYYNVALAVGFTPGTFRGYQQSFWYSSGFLWCVAAATVVIVAVCAWAVQRFIRMQRH